jgi:hypothetical protein
MMPTFPRPSLSFRTAGFPQYGWKAGFPSGAFPDRQRLKPAPGVRRQTSGLHPPFVRLVVPTVVPHCVGPQTRLRTAVEDHYSSAPGALARVRVVVSRSVITYSAPSVPLVGTPRFHRMAAYTRCLRCAGAPRRPASGSGLSLLIPSWHAILYDPGESDHRQFQSNDVGMPSPRVDRLGTPKAPAIRFTRAMTFGATWFTHLLRPARLLAPQYGSDHLRGQRGLLLPGFQRVRPVAGYDCSSDWTLLLAGLSPARMTASLAAPTPSS